jgi:predicted acylesterase/phospholipase RssA
MTIGTSTGARMVALVASGRRLDALQKRRRELEVRRSMERAALQIERPLFFPVTRWNSQVEPATGPGLERSVFVPSPSWAALLLPQQ